MAEVEMIPVNSSLLASVGLDSETGEGRAIFAKTGALYGYPNCTQDELNQIVSGAVGGSQGQTFNLLWRPKPGYYRIS